MLHPAWLHRGALSGRPKSTGPAQSNRGLIAALNPRGWRRRWLLWAYQREHATPRAPLHRWRLAGAHLAHSRPQARSRRARAQEWLLADEAAVRVHLDRGGSSQGARPPSRSRTARRYPVSPSSPGERGPLRASGGVGGPRRSSGPSCRAGPSPHGSRGALRLVSSADRADPAASAARNISCAGVVYVRL